MAARRARSRAKSELDSNSRTLSLVETKRRVRPICSLVPSPHPWTQRHKPAGASRMFHQLLKCHSLFFVRIVDEFA